MPQDVTRGQIRSCDDPTHSIVHTAPQNCLLLYSELYLLLVGEVSDEAVLVVVLGGVEGHKLGEVGPVAVVLVAHVVSHTTETRDMGTLLSVISHAMHTDYTGHLTCGSKGQ